MVAQNYGIFAQAGFCGGDTFIERIVRDQKIGIKIAAYAFFDFRRAHGRRLLGTDEAWSFYDGDEIAHFKILLCSSKETALQMIR